jgi:EAL domain-containing protein (putative c-di-GMP-specific phosphodiesterase class I)
MHSDAVSRFTLAQDLRRALSCDQVAMHYQPIVRLATGEIVGFEALMRWRHPEHGFVAPDVFIPLAEESDLILGLGDFALREATRAASRWGASGDASSGPLVTVNLSAHQFLDPALASKVEEALASSGLAPGRLLLEITEGVMLQDTTETLDVIERIHALGVRLALDDFGTGYSSLSYLASFESNVIKIDRSFVRHVHDGGRGDLLLEMIMNMGHQLGVTMLAEGIETSEQLEHLRRMSCELGQGYLFSGAVPEHEVDAMLHDTEGVARWRGLPFAPRIFE